MNYMPKHWASEITVEFLGKSIVVPFSEKETNENRYPTYYTRLKTCEITIVEETIGTRVYIDNINGAYLIKEKGYNAQVAIKECEKRLLYSRKSLNAIYDEFKA